MRVYFVNLFHLTFSRTICRLSSPIVLKYTSKKIQLIPQYRFFFFNMCALDVCAKYFRVCMPYVGKESIQFSKTAELKRAPTFYRKGRRSR